MADGFWYKGEFRQDFMHGHGFMQMENKDMFDGNFFQGKKIFRAHGDEMQQKTCKSDLSLVTQISFMSFAMTLHKLLAGWIHGPGTWTCASTGKSIHSYWSLGTELERMTAVCSLLALW